MRDSETDSPETPSIHDRAIQTKTMTAITVEAPMPGVLYRRPNPDEEVFVSEGDAVEAGDTLGLIGVMKTYNDIVSPAAGVVEEILIENEEEIVAGDELFVIRSNE